MNLNEAAHFALENLTANKMRSGLTMLGMIIGTASIILVVTIALTSREYILRQIEGVGSNLIYSYYEAGGQTVSGTKRMSDNLNWGDLKAIRELPGVSSAAAIVVDHDRVAIGGHTREVTIIGTTPEYARVRNLHILSGQFFTDSDDQSFNKVCVVTPGLAWSLFGTLHAAGNSLKIFQVRFTVIGVFQEGTETFGTSEISDFSALIPASVMRSFTRTAKLDEIFASAAAGALVPSLTKDIEELLASRHRSGAVYRVENLAEILKAASRISTALSIVLFLIGGISLIISGIGIMNIMLVTVTERTREIGVKMALGARRHEILLQFLAESLSIAALGSGFGILLGVSAPLIAKKLTGLDIPISGISILLALALSIGVGATFGLIPANRAAKLSPTEALRYE
jgi:putative ABC transport system permease protein